MHNSLCHRNCCTTIMINVKFAVTMLPCNGSPYFQHRVATLLVQHGRRHQNHPTRNLFLKSCRFRLCLVQAAVVNLFVLNLMCFISVCPCIPETSRLENTYSCCGFWLWSWLAAVVNLFVLDVVLHFRLPIPETGRL